HRVGRVYLKDAQYAYNHWGGRAKAEELEHRYPEVFEDMAKAEHPLFVHGLHTTTTEHAVSQTLDLASILKASQAISGEIVFDQLLSQLMTVLMENAGAQRGALILAQDDDLKIEAWAEVDKKPVTVLKNEYLEDAGDKLSLAIVHYVVRSRETVVTGRAEQSDYANDPYIVARQPKSILCFPVVSRGKFVGALYLENNLVSDAFTPERVEMLSLLSAQIAISLENSRLFTRLEESRDEITGWNQQLERKVKERTTDLIQAFEQLKELDHLKTDFLSMVSHELRTPITSIIGFASLIRRRLQELGGVMVETENGRQVTASQQIQQYVDIIQTESERLTNLINDLLDISQLESGKMEWRIEKVDFGELIEKAGTAVGSLLEQKNLAFISEIEPDLPVVLGDSERLMQVLINLLSNAVKFTDQGAITCRAFQCENGITVQVADTGVGIESHNYEEIFERFKQISGEKRGRPKGTGLGLPICKQIVEYHGGRIWVESEPGKGTVFSFFLPERQDNPRVFRT
ncbi:MAG: ATP-binding protein, partial [Solirubrobacterales bacterium]